MKRTLMILLAVVMTTGMALADPGAGAGPSPEAKSLSVRTFQFKFKSADKAAGVIKSLLSGDGTMSIQPKANSLVVTDHAENIKAVANAISEYDAAPRAVKLNVRLIAASKSETASRPVEELKDLARSFSMMGFNSLDSLGSANVESHEGEGGTINLADGYRAEFHFGEYDPASDTIQLADFRISKLKDDQLTEIYKTTLNVTVGQTVVLTVARPKGQRALSVAFVARR